MPSSSFSQDLEGRRSPPTSTVQSSLLEPVPTPKPAALLTTPLAGLGKGRRGRGGPEGLSSLLHQGLHQTGRRQNPPQRGCATLPRREGPLRKGTHLARCGCGAGGRALAVVLSLATLLLRRLGGPSAERRGAGLEFWGSNSSSGMTSSQRAPRKPERHTQSWGRLQEPRFWQGGWHTAAETGRG